MAKFVKFARHGAPSPIEHQAWRQLMDNFDAHLDSIVEASTEEEIVDLWLENPMPFMEGMIEPTGSSRVASGVRRIQVGGTGLRRVGSPAPKTASMNDWDQDFADAKAHVARVLGNMPE